MKKSNQDGISIKVIIVLSVIFMLWSSGRSLAQENLQSENSDRSKIFSEIAGTWEFEFQGEIIIFEFKVEKGILFAGPEGGEAAELTPVEGKELEYTVIQMEQEAEVLFSRGENGKITKCLIKNTTQGFEFEGNKIDDGLFIN
ncbi:MAG: hypothetical protein GY863_20600 [bacterium]|nr:hypothetical protein [bacterium]